MTLAREEHAGPSSARPDDEPVHGTFARALGDDEPVQGTFARALEDDEPAEERTRVRALEDDEAPRRGLSAVLRDLWRSVRPQRSRERLPARVLGSVARNERISEVLVRLIQFAIFASWGLFYTLSPKPASMFDSLVPQVIAAYLALTLVLVWIGTRRKLPDWSVYLSIAVDMALLTLLIWSFHVQYAQPPAFYLKDPAMLNFLLLIALRALRFEARYVLAAGALAIAAWLFLVGYAILVPDVSPVTRDYVSYVTSNRVLIGAEVSRIIAMAMFTGVLALSVRRASTFLVTALTQTNAADELSRFFPDVVARLVRDADHQIRPGEGERREVAILNVDIRGFTELSSSKPPGWTVSLLSQYQALVIPVIRRHDGLVDKFMGDGIMATFGTTDDLDGPRTYAADALRALDEVLAVVERAVAAQPRSDLARLDVNYAVVAGPVVFGTVGDEERLEYTVIGPSVNLSAKLEKHNKVLGSRALTDRRTWEQARKQGYRPPNPEPRVVQTQVTGTDTVLDCVIVA